MSLVLSRYAAALALGAGLGVLASSAWTDEPGDAAGHAHHRPDPAQGSALAQLSIRPHAGERVALSFTLTGPSGAPIGEVLPHHARKLHVFIVSDDMEVIGHIHPQDFGRRVEGGRATVHFTFPRPGRYLVAADFMTRSGPGASHFVVQVAGEESGVQPDLAAPKLAVPRLAVVELAPGDRATDPVLLTAPAPADGYEVSLVRPSRIEAGEPAGFTYRIALDGRPVTELRPYLEAPLHLAVVKEDLTHFVHEHGAVGGEPAAAHAHHSGSHDQGQPGYEGPATFGPALAARLSFPEPGRYFLFGQAAHGDRLLVSRFAVEVR